MQFIRRATERGSVDMGWLKSQHSFSFGSYYDPKHMGFSVLRVINDDIVAPSQGFPEHGHRDMEIISYVTSGVLEHQDSTGNKIRLSPGEVQRMSAGSGIRHSEYNASSSESVNLLQIWIEPNEKGMTPSYEQKRILQEGFLTPLATADAVNGSLKLHQDAGIYRLVLDANQDHTLKTGHRLGYLHIVKGTISANGDTFSAGDAFAVGEGETVYIIASSALEALWFDLPS